MKVQVLVRLKPGVLDVQGKAVERGLQENGYQDISDVRVGRLVEFQVQASSLEQARPKIEKICNDLLANPIIESFEIKSAA